MRMLLLSLLLLLIQTPALSQSAIPAGYMSRAGAVLDTYQPNVVEYTPENMANAASRFLATLTKEERKLAQLDLTDSEHQQWTNSPVRSEVGGIALGALDETQLHALFDLLAVLLKLFSRGTAQRQRAATCLIRSKVHP